MQMSQKTLQMASSLRVQTALKARLDLCDTVERQLISLGAIAGSTAVVPSAAAAALPTETSSAGAGLATDLFHA